jgi:multiple sugar transport system ATP-binding protein
MGFIDCCIQRSADSVELITDSARIHVSAARARALMQMAGERVIIGIRPERLALVPEHRARTTEVAVRGTVEVVEMLGAEQYVHVIADGGSLTARVPRDQPVRVDETVTLAAASRDLHLFDRKTGLALC